MSGKKRVRLNHLLTQFTILASVVNLLSLTPVWGQESVRVWEEDVVMPSYRLEAPDPNPIFYKNESYQGAQKRIYPYPFQEHVTNIREERPFRFVFLENDYIRLSVLPEIGGRLFSALDKTNNYEIFYHQSVVKPALIGMLGAWISGGIEWCVFHHHRNTTHMPVDYMMTDNPDGSATIWIGETERRHRMKWLIGITLFPDKSYIEATVKLFNRTPLPHSMLYWANVAVHANDEYQVIFPPSVQYATYHSKNDFAHWPVSAESYQGVDYRGVDLSWWKNHPEPISFFAWDLQEDFMGGYDHGREAGVVHVGNHHIVKGAKLWEWSPGPRGRMWDKILTDTDGPYAELMVGAYSDNQPDYSWIKPYEVRTFKHYWYPVREIGGFKNANLEAAANLQFTEGKIQIGINTTQSQKDIRVIVRGGSDILFERVADIAPENPFTAESTIETNWKESDLELELLDSSGRQILRYKPKVYEYDPSLPETVTPPRVPKDIQTVEELYLTGLRVQQIHSPSVDPDAYFAEALRRDPGDTRANTVVGIKLNQRGLYEEAQKHFEKALERLTAEYTRPSNGEAHFNLGLSLKAQGKTEAAYDHLYQAAWDAAFTSSANLELAMISISKNDFEVAGDQVAQSIAFNALNTKARVVQAIALRKRGLEKEAVQVVKQALEVDPLDFLARNEWLLLSTSPEKTEILSELRQLMRDDVQTYLELATDYSQMGLWEEAIQVLRRPVESKMEFAATFPLVYYYLGYYSDRIGQEAESLRYLELAKEMPHDYCFPFRLESIDVLESAIAADPRDARALYYLGNLLFEIQPERAIRAWKRSAVIDPGFPLTFRNLGWASYRHSDDVSEAIKNYEKAVSLDTSDPRFFTELDQLYEAGNVSPEVRLAQLEKNHGTVISTNPSFLRQIMVSVLVGNYDAAIDALLSNFFHVREGGGEIHDVFVDAHLLRGLKYLRSGENEKALEDFLKAAEYPENLSVGVPRRDRRAAQVAYATAMAYEALGKDREAVEYLERIVALPQGRGWAESQFYRALALKRLGKNDEAASISIQLKEDGNRRLQEQPSVDFFAKFGEQETSQSRKAMGYYILGLGQLSSDEVELARESFQRSASLNQSNVWAKFYLENQESGSTN